jgi:hypothetical protein
MSFVLLQGTILHCNKSYKPKEDRVTAQGQSAGRSCKLRQLTGRKLVS